MGKSSPSAPAAPNPKVVAGAQTAQNVSTAIAQGVMNNINQNTPYGSLAYKQTGTHQMTDPNTGKMYDLPQYTANQTFTPDGQALFDSSMQTQKNLGQIGVEQSSRVRDLLSNNLSFDGQPSVRGQEIDNIQGLDTDFAAQRDQAQAALFARMNPQLDRARAAMEDRLASQGIRMGSGAYSDAMGDLSRGENDARLAMIGQAGNEQARMQQMAAQQQQVNNQAAAQRYGLSQDQRSRALQEVLTLRNQPLNEISALMSGSQVQQPNFVNTNPAQMANTDAAGITMGAHRSAMDAYNAAQGRNSDLIGGLIGGAAKIGAAAMPSDERVKRDIQFLGMLKGQKIYLFRYVGSEAMQIGVMAQDIEQTKPSAVREAGGVKMVNYGMVFQDE